MAMVADEVVFVWTVVSPSLLVVLEEPVADASVEKRPIVETTNVERRALI